MRAARDFTLESDDPRCVQWDLLILVALSGDLTQVLVGHQNRQPEGHPYVFVPPARCDYIQKKLRTKATGATPTPA